MADLVEMEEFVGLVTNAAVFEWGKRQTPGVVRYVSVEMQELHGRRVVLKQSDASRSIPSVDRIRSDQGNESWMMRYVGDGGILVKDSSLKRAA